MTAPRLLFGLDVPTVVGQVPDPTHAAQTAEALGFDFVSVNDHVLGAAPLYEAWTLLSALAGATSRLRLATRVLGAPYRHPVIVAKMAETFDRLFDGRLILGLGAGSGQPEFAAMGLAAGDTGERVAGLEEAVEIIRGLWSATPFTHAGRRYKIADAALEPKPGHDIPIWLGAVGPRGLELVGRFADGWIPSLGFAPPDDIPAMVERFTAAAARAGRDPGRIARIYNVEVSLIEPPDEGTIGGPPEAIAERLIGFTRMGFTGFNFLIGGPDREMQVERLAGEVLPAVRAGA